ncbi:MAG: hypothetical protein Hyperionvirus5_70 [Hyperionvirus sp.]|uniref:Uncharacterized protein n=1 Tax=Hyperionvirus sp. TaxID=2487770 RepID=A0A3G5A9U6_9VIRU|nr:MAG: hypothetical protein Hyperionvirus5_70 [Hyperionvirus sp.]
MELSFKFIFNLFKLKIHLIKMEGLATAKICLARCYG